MYGGRLLFRASGALSLVCCALHGMVQMLSLKCDQHSQHTEEEVDPDNTRRLGFSKVATRDTEETQ